MTRFERFKGMSTEEISEYLERFSNKICENYDSCGCCPLHFGKNITCNKHGFIEWLNEEIDKDRGESL